MHDDDDALTVRVGTVSVSLLLPKELRDIERLAVVGTLQLCGGNMTQAAQLLGIDRRTLYRKVESFRIDREALQAMTAPTTADLVRAMELLDDAEERLLADEIRRLAALSDAALSRLGVTRDDLRRARRSMRGRTATGAI